MRTSGHRYKEVQWAPYRPLDALLIRVKSLIMSVRTRIRKKVQKAPHGRLLQCRYSDRRHTYIHLILPGRQYQATYIDSCPPDTRGGKYRTIGKYFTCGAEINFERMLTKNKSCLRTKYDERHHKSNSTRKARPVGYKKTIRVPSES